MTAALFYAGDGCEGLIGLEAQALYDGATRVGTNERTKLLRRKSLEPRNRPQETIQAGVSDLV